MVAELLQLSQLAMQKPTYLAKDLRSELHSQSVMGPEQVAVRRMAEQVAALHSEVQ